MLHSIEIILSAEARWEAAKSLFERGLLSPSAVEDFKGPYFAVNQQKPGGVPTHHRLTLDSSGGSFCVRVSYYADPECAERAIRSESYYYPMHTVDRVKVVHE